MQGDMAFDLRGEVIKRALARGLGGDAGGELALQDIIAGDRHNFAFQNGGAAAMIDQHHFRIQTQLSARGGRTFCDVEIGQRFRNRRDAQNIARLIRAAVTVETIDQGIAQILSGTVGDAVDIDVIESGRRARALCAVFLRIERRETAGGEKQAEQ